MSNYGQVKKEVIDYLRARTLLIIIDTQERERAHLLLSQIAAELAAPIHYYTDAGQVNDLFQKATKDVDGDPLAYALTYYKKTHGGIFALGDVHHISEDCAYVREILDALYEAKKSDGTMVLISADIIWPRLAQMGMFVQLDRPDEEERITLITEFILKYRTRYTFDLDTEGIRKAATLLCGFSEIQIDNILCAQTVAREGLFQKDLHELTKQKSRLYAVAVNVQPVEVRRDLCVLGLDRLKVWLAGKKVVFFAPDEQLAARDLQIPKGVLLTGIPGCGKSFSAKMVANEWELPLFRFDVGNVYDKWVGESEKRMKEALQYIDNVSPCVIWIDEIEKVLATSDGGNDTGKRVLGQFLFWLQESIKRVFLVATANDISQMPPELFRKGRFSEIFFVDLPNVAERKEALFYYAKRSLHITLSDVAVQTLAERTEGFSYSDIESAVKDLAQMTLYKGEQVVSEQNLQECLDMVVPIAKSSAQAVQKMQDWAHDHALSASTQPEVIKNEQ